MKKAQDRDEAVVSKVSVELADLGTCSPSFDICEIQYKASGEVSPSLNYDVLRYKVLASYLMDHQVPLLSATIRMSGPQVHLSMSGQGGVRQHNCTALCDEVPTLLIIRCQVHLSKSGQGEISQQSLRFHLWSSLDLINRLLLKYLSTIFGFFQQKNNHKNSNETVFDFF